MIHCHIDVLDSNKPGESTTKKLADDKMRKSVIERFLDVMDVIYKGKFTKVRNWKRCIEKVPHLTQNGDSGFLAMKYMQFWDGNKLAKDVNPLEVGRYRQEQLYYILFHPMNSAPLPSVLDVFRPNLVKA